MTPRRSVSALALGLEQEEEHMKRVFFTLLLMAVVTGAALADAPDTGTVTGTISDPSGAGLPGVNITISSDRGEKFTVSGNDGVYRFALLVPSAYNLEAELEGLGNASQAVNVTAGGRHNVDQAAALGPPQRRPVALTNFHSLNELKYLA